MSYQCTNVTSDLTYREVEAWWNMLNCVFKFIRASTDYALETCSQAPNQNPVLLIELPDTYKDINLEDFPWFLDLFDESTKIEEISSDKDYNVYHAATVSYETNQHEEPNPPVHIVNIVNTQNNGDSSVLENKNNENIQNNDTFASFYGMIKNMHALEESNMKMFAEKQEEKLYLVAKAHEIFKGPKTYTITSNTTLKGTKEIKNEPEKIEPLSVVTNSSEESCYFQDYTDSADTINSLNLQSNSESITAVDNLKTSTLIIKDNQNDFPHISQVDQRMDNNRVTPINVKSVTAANKDSQQIEHESGTDVDSMVSEEIQTTVNKRFSGTLKAQIAKSEELQKPLKEINVCNTNYSKTAGILSVPSNKGKAGELTPYVKETAPKLASEKIIKYPNSNLKKVQIPQVSSTKNSAPKVNKIKFLQNTSKDNKENNLVNKKQVIKKVPTAKNTIDFSIEVIVNDIIAQSTLSSETQNRLRGIMNDKQPNVLKWLKSKPNTTSLNTARPSTASKVSTITANNKNSSNASSISSSKSCVQRKTASSNLPLKPFSASKINEVKYSVVPGSSLSNRNNENIRKFQSKIVKDKMSLPPAQKAPAAERPSTRKPQLSLSQKTTPITTQRVVKVPGSVSNTLRKPIPKTSIKK